MGNSSDICLGRQKKGPERFAEITPEEAYMIKKQQDLKLFVHSCYDLEQAFLSNLNFHSIKENEFLDILVDLKLLRIDNPEHTVAWQNFYTRLKIDQTEAGVLKPHFDIRCLMISLYFLTSTNASTKGKYITQLFVEYGYYQDFEDKQVVDIKVENQDKEKKVKWEKVFQPGENVKEEIMKNNKILKKSKEVKQIFTIFTAIALNLLPYFASDFPENDKSLYYKFYCQWNAIRDLLEEKMLKNFCKFDEEMTPNLFIERASEFPQYFDSFGLRDEAKRLIEDEIARHNEGKGGISDEMPAFLQIDVPAKYAQAYLFKIVSKQTKQQLTLDLNQNRSHIVEGTKLEPTLNIKRQITKNVHKNIERSKARNLDDIDVWEEGDKTSKSKSGSKRRGRQERNQKQGYAKYINAPLESQV